MSFSSDVRLELARIPVEKTCDARAELCAVILAGGGLTFKGSGHYGLTLHSESQPISERFIALLHKHLHTSSDLRIQHTDRLGGQVFHTIHPEPAHIPHLLDALRLIDPSAPFGMRTAPDPALLGSECCRRAFMRGAFLSCGSVTNPEKSYHLEFAVGSSELCDCLLELMRGFSLPMKRTTRKAQFVAYLKGAEYVSDALALLGASRAVMAFENVRILKGISNEVNRQVNCDQSNLDKSVAAAQKQLSIIRAIERHMDLRDLPAPLYDLAELRLQNPDATLQQLGQMLTPALGKSGVNARMRKLEALAEELINR